MTTPTRTQWARVGTAAAIVALGVAVALSAAKPADARVFVGVGFGFPIGFPGFYYPPYPYYPPPIYPAPAYYPPPGYYPPPAPPGGYAPSGPSGTPPITYTPRPGWTNAQGEFCREYKATQGAGSRATEKYGTACRDVRGQWRIVN
jgi:hypothetical protein